MRPPIDEFGWKWAHSTSGVSRLNRVERPDLWVSLTAVEHRPRGSATVWWPPMSPQRLSGAVRDIIPHPPLSEAVEGRSWCLNGQVRDRSERLVFSRVMERWNGWT
jgi:hypothetical protein